MPTKYVPRAFGSVLILNISSGIGAIIVGKGRIPTDDNGKIALALWNDATGQVLPLHVGSTLVGSDGNTYATMDVHLADGTGVPLGTVANPLATNQVVGTPVYATATASAAAACTATLPAVSGKTTYLNGFVCTSHAPSGNVFGTVTVSLDGGTTTHMNFIYLESSTLGGELNIDFPDPIPATAQNKSIVITIPAITSGAASAISVFGYQL